MYLMGEALVTSATDLTLASGCEYGFLRVLDYRLGWNTDPLPPDDAMLEQASQLGNVHELRTLERYRAEYCDGVVEFDRPEGRDAGILRDYAKRTRDAMLAGAPVVYQGVFYDEEDPTLPFVGYADFLVRQPDGRYRIVDTKLARHVKVTALLQLAAYHEQLQKLGVPVDDQVELILGNDKVETAHIDEIRPVFQRRRARMHAIIAEHLAAGHTVQWGDERYSIDGRCKYCAEPAAAADDLITVAGMRLTQRQKLRDAGITTLSELAAALVRPEGCSIPQPTYEKLQLQAALQSRAKSGANGEPPPYEVTNPQPIAGLPEPSPGDLFFDFEGDPMYAETLADGSQRWNLDYLFGWVDASGEFDALWAHSQAEEATALLAFLDMVEARLVEHPDLHIYHYAAYEKTHLLSIAARHGAGEERVDSLLREGVLVDLYPVVTSSLRIGVNSYSIKKLEPLYMGDEEREGISGGADSVVQYAVYRAAVEAGEWEQAEAILADIAQYNAYDCRSTLALRDWLRALPEVQGVAVSVSEREGDEEFEVSELDLKLQELGMIAEGEERGEDAAAYRLAAAAVDFHRRERKSFWWEHYDRLVQPAELWEGTRNIFVVESGRVEVDWIAGPRGGKPKRVLALRGKWAPGSSQVKEDLDIFLAYGEPVPFRPPGHRPGQRVVTYASVISEEPDGTLLVKETLADDAEAWSALPSHVLPGKPLRTDSIVNAIAQWGQTLVDHAPSWPEDAMVRMLRRDTPSASGALEAMASADDSVRAVTASLLGMDAGYLAVQGPPGTGKTYLAAHVIKDLVEKHHWKIGVTAQSHKVIENVLDAIVTDAGLDHTLVGKKKDKSAGASGNYVTIPDKGFALFAVTREGSGYVIGGTAWDMTNRNRISAGQLDLLVIDEAGQFSLANTIATALSAKRILLLGDPQQLPQVSQGLHPAPVDGSALGHVIGQASVLPAEYGYFLAESRRMDPAVTLPVSRLAYEGKLRSHDSVLGRSLSGVTPGLHVVEVPHSGNATSSVEEAAAVVELVRQHLGLTWVGDAGVQDATTTLSEDDLIVVTPYNAQVETLRAALDAEGFAGVSVGTVDKFQGREAVIAIVSLAASDPNEVPRGMEFLLNRNRLNVSISRAKWAAYLVYSPALTEFLPQRQPELAMLSNFITLVEGAVVPAPTSGG
jgi:predicted RecB family nuclease